MARIVVQTDDHQTVLEEPDVQVSDVSNARARLQLMGRLQAAVGDAERTPPASPAGEAPADDPAGIRLPRGRRLAAAVRRGWRVGPRRSPRPPAPTPALSSTAAQ